jgi:hypothetical protein
MKNYKNFTVLICVLFGVILLSACKKESPNIQQQEEEDLYEKYVTPALEEGLKELGMVINRGLNPPKIEGYYIFSPYLIESTVPSDMAVGYPFDDFYFSFLNQRGFLVDLLGYEYSSNIRSIHYGNGTFITGKDDLFTIFIEHKGEREYTSGKKFLITTVMVISGKVNNNPLFVNNRLEDMTLAIIMKDNDGDDQVIDNNTGRLFEEYVSTKSIDKEEFDAFVNKNFGSGQAHIVNKDGRSSVFSIIQQ